jgi:hypothetical protein
MPAILVALLANAVPGQRNDAANAPFQLPVRLGALPEKALSEASGVVRSRRCRDTFWLHNDSGGRAEVCAVRADGTLLRRVVVPTATNVDWEDLAIDARGRMVVGDIGDNFAEREEHVLYRFDEPDPEGREPVTRVEAIRYRAPAGCERVDSEAMWIAGDFAFVVTKEARTARLLRVPLPPAAERPSGRSVGPEATTEPTRPAPLVAAELVGILEGLQRVTGAAVSDDGRHVALLTYQGVVVIDSAEPLQPSQPAADVLATLSQAPRREQAMLLGQCEGIAFDGDDLVVATEKGPLRWGHPLLWRLVPK